MRKLNREREKQKEAILHNSKRNGRGNHSNGKGMVKEDECASQIFQEVTKSTWIQMTKVNVPRAKGTSIVPSQEKY